MTTTVKIQCSLSVRAALALPLSLLACGGGSRPEEIPVADAGRDDVAIAPEREAGAEAGETAVPDGPPSYTSACTPLAEQTGTAIDTKHGRLDGYLAYVVPQSGPASCNGDDSHVHLQVRMNGAIYDVAVDIGTFTGDSNLYEMNMPMPQGAWSEGWHDVGLSYPELGLHSAQFSPEEPAILAQKIQSELASANHISIFGDAYAQGNGCHDVHYENGANDGALVIDPLSPNPHIMFFRFSTQSF